jgi:hypothetical protein
MARRRPRKTSDKPVGGGGARHPNSLANLRSAPPAPLGHTRSLIHGGRSELLVASVEPEVVELMTQLGDRAPVRGPDGKLPEADLIIFEVGARALKRYRHLTQHNDLHGRIVERTGELKPSAVLELQAERQLVAFLDRTGMSPLAREKIRLQLTGAHRSSLASFIEGTEAP